ncbi:MAG: acyl carrier protein, partial [Symploca sp. SIO1C4]|nr:acyl carrier protein [Symploca sp. SIO1C4]
GHSLLATQVISRVGELFAVPLSLQTFLEYPTVARLAKTIEVLSLVVNSSDSMASTPTDYEKGEL